MKNSEKILQATQKSQDGKVLQHPILFSGKIFSNLHNTWFELNKLLNLNFGGVFLIAGSRSSGKSTFAHIIAKFLLAGFVKPYQAPELNSLKPSSIAFPYNDVDYKIQSSLFDDDFRIDSSIANSSSIPLKVSESQDSGLALESTDVNQDSSFDASISSRYDTLLIKKPLSEIFQFLTLSKTHDLDSLSHPDLFALSDRYFINSFALKERKGISVDEIRDAIRFLQQTPLLYDKKVLIIDGMESLNDNGVNALLKVAEEYSPSSYIFMITSNPHSLPLTLLSRCKRITLPRPSLDDVVDYFSNFYNLHPNTESKHDDVLLQDKLEFMYKILDADIAAIKFCIDCELIDYLKKLRVNSSLLEYRRILYNLKIKLLEIIEYKTRSIDMTLVASIILSIFGYLIREALLAHDSETADYYLKKYQNIEEVLNQLQFAELDPLSCVATIL